MIKKEEPKEKTIEKNSKGVDESKLPNRPATDESIQNIAQFNKKRACSCCQLS